MQRCLIDDSIARKTTKGFQFPLGVYPIEPMTPAQGFHSEYEPADGDESIDDIEAWPDRYVFDIVISATRLEALWVQVFSMMPGRIFPILDYIGHDAYREIDPYIAYEPVGQERMTNLLQRYKDFFFEDGMVGFGAVSEEPFFYAFVDEHKIMTLRVEPEMKPTIERLLASFDLEETQEPAGADAAAHEHRSVLIAPSDRPELLNADEIVESARERWGLVLNVDPETNLDDEGNTVGMTLFRCLLRLDTDQTPKSKYAEVYCIADCLIQAETFALEAVDTFAELPSPDIESSELFLLSANRVHLDKIGIKSGGSILSKAPSKKHLQQGGVLNVRWLTDDTE